MPSLRDRLAAARTGWSTGRKSPWHTGPPRRARIGRRGAAAPTGGNRSGRWAEVRDFVHTMFQGVTVLTAVAALLFTARSLDYTADATGATRDQLRLTEQGQISDRFGKAVDHLGQEGTDKLSIRLGGIYALERVMRDSAADEPTVIEVLCAFIRTHAPSPPKPSPSAGRADGPATAPSSPDVQAAVTVLARRPDPTATGNSRLDLSGTLLGLPDAALPGANLAGANLAGANLAGANLGGANLVGANLVDANLGGATLAGANLGDANLFAATLTAATLAGANLTVAYLGSAMLIYANLTDANLTNAILDDATLSGADLRGVSLTDVVGLTTEQLANAGLDAGTRLPDGVVRPSPTR